MIAKLDPLSMSMANQSRGREVCEEGKWIDNAQCTKVEITDSQESSQNRDEAKRQSA